MYGDLISIICPCFNAEGCIRNIIDDVRNQTYKFWELIVVSNGKNQEKQLSIIKEFANKDSRVKLIHDNIGGVSRARNTGIKNSNGKWITFVDADDRIDVHHLQNYIDVLDNRSELVIVGVEVYDDNTKKCLDIIRLKDLDSLTYPKGFNGTVQKLMSSSWTFYAVWNKLYSKEIIEHNDLYFDPELPFSEDYIFCVNYIMACSRIQFVDKTSYHYIRNSNSACSRFHSNMNECLIKRTDVSLQLYKKLGYEIQHLDKAKVQLDYHRLYNTITNLYKYNCPLSSCDKIEDIRNILKTIGDYRELTQKWRKCDPGGMQEKIFDVIIATGSPIIIHYTMTILFWFWKRMK